MLEEEDIYPVFTRLRGAILYQLNKILRNNNDQVNDAVSIGLTNLVEAIRNGRQIESRTADAYVFATMLNAARDIRRRAHREQAKVEALGRELERSEGLFQEQNRTVLSRMADELCGWIMKSDTLTLEHKLIFIDKYRERMSLAAIAKKHRVSQSTVERRLEDCKAVLRRQSVNLIVGGLNSEN